MAAAVVSEGKSAPERAFSRLDTRCEVPLPSLFLNEKDLFHPTVFEEREREGVSTRGVVVLIMDGGWYSCLRFLVLISRH